MRNGQTPIHIQRWAPADYLADEHVKLLVARRDYPTIAFYRHFIDCSFVAGGDLPSDPEMLAAVLSFPKSHVVKALDYCTGRLLFVDGDRIFQPRVRREVAEELEFREKQRDSGSKGGLKRASRLALDEPQGQPKDSPSPPAPFASASRLSPAPAPIAGESGATGSREPDADASPVLLTFRAQGKQDAWHLTERQSDEWQKLYPGLDVRACCRKAFAWAEANPDKRKTAKGMPAFLVNWLNREANSPKVVSVFTKNPEPEYVPNYHKPYIPGSSDGY